MKTKNKIGPSTDPCGTPEVTVTWEISRFLRRQSVIKERQQTLTHR